MPASPSVYILGAGKVGRALAGALRRRQVAVTLRAARRGWPRRLRADIVVLAVRDSALSQVAQQLDGSVRHLPQLALVHCAGALSADVLAGAAPPGVSLGKWHPLLSFTNPRKPPPFDGAFALVAGQAGARRAAEQLCRWLGMTPITAARLDPTLYHAGAALLANGLAALMDAAIATLVTAGLDRGTAQQMLLPLAKSVTANIHSQGLPQALSGPLRRGAADTVAAHLAALDRQIPAVAALYRALGRAQLPMAEALRDATPEALARTARALNAPLGAASD